MRHNPHPSPTLGRLAAASMAALFLLAGCGDKSAAAPGAAGLGGVRPPPEVGVVTVKMEPVALQTELPGRVEPVRVAQVRARVNGVVLKRLFIEGSEVKQGQSLFQIDPAPYAAQLNSARAALGKSQANLNVANAQAARYKPLVEANAVSAQEYDNIVATQKQAQADVAAQQAAVQIAKINTGYTNVYAPISGRIGRALVTEGALVSATEATQLALIQQTNSVYVNFTQSATQLQRLRKAAGGQASSGGAPVTIMLDDGSELAQKGKLLFSDVSVDPTSGQVTLRAQVPNADNALLPGQYVRARIAQASLPSAMLVPQQAVTRGSQGDSVIVVAQDGKTSPRPVTISTQQGSNWVVVGGLKEGEMVVVDGFQKMQAPGMTVKPVPWGPAAGPATATAAATPAVAAATK